MGQCFLYGNGGSAGWRVAVGLSEPGAPRENMLWVKSDRAGGKYVFAEAEPKNPSEGLIWFRVSSMGIITRADVYTDGAWVAADTYMYLGGVWVQIAVAWDGTLFDNGNQYEAVTGGWTLSKFSLKDGAFDTGLTSQTSGNDVLACSVNKIAVEEYKTLHIRCYSNFSNSGGRGSAKFGLSNNNGKSDDWGAYIRIDTKSNTLTEYSIDISSVPGSYYIKFYANIASQQGWLKIAKIWLT